VFRVLLLAYKSSIDFCQWLERIGPFKHDEINRDYLQVMQESDASSCLMGKDRA
jgi:hypothetical protein